MSTLNKIFDKITDKTELASYKIDLGLLQDAQKMVTASEKAWISANQKVNIINAKAKEAVDALMSAEAENNRALNLVNTLIKNTKDLGLSISPESQKMYDMLTTRNKSLSAGVSAIKSINVQQIKG